jgi:plastocyanin
VRALLLGFLRDRRRGCGNAARVQRSKPDAGGRGSADTRRNLEKGAPMILTRLSLLVTVALALVLTAGASASTPGHASLVIRHQTHGCHSWSLAGGAFKASQSVTLRRGSWLAVTNDDVMPHTLVLTSGPAVRIAQPTLRHMGASLRVTLTRPGVYHFTTKAGEDYMSGIKTIGNDNVLKLTVVVT